MNLDCLLEYLRLWKFGLDIGGYRTKLEIDSFFKNLGHG
jgi:hypothetical protein